MIDVDKSADRLRAVVNSSDEVKTAYTWLRAQPEGPVPTPGSDEQVATAWLHDDDNELVIVAIANVGLLVMHARYGVVVDLVGAKDSARTSAAKAYAMSVLQAADLLGDDTMVRDRTSGGAS